MAVKPGTCSSMRCCAGGRQWQRLSDERTVQPRCALWGPEACPVSDMAIRRQPERLVEVDARGCAVFRRLVSQPHGCGRFEIAASGWRRVDDLLNRPHELQPALA